jgi:GT2 family glycosyltransferase
MPVRLIEKVGGFNPLFFQYSEDNNNYQRMVYHGQGTTRFVPKAKMYHDRQIHGNVQVYNHHQLRRDMLLLASNINLSFPHFVAKWLRLFLRCYVYDLWRRQYIPGTYTIDTLWLLSKAKTINSSRKKEKQDGLTWLS